MAEAARSPIGASGEAGGRDGGRRGDDDDEDGAVAGGASPSSSPPSFRVGGDRDRDDGGPSPLLHAHFDCFSGAAGDMMLGSLLDACRSRRPRADPRSLLDRILADIAGGMPEIEGEFDARIERVWRGGMGSIAAAKVEVWSKWSHAAAPVPGRGGVAAAAAEEEEAEDVDGHEHAHAHDHAHKEGEHDHTHEHGHGHDHRSEKEKGSFPEEKEASGGEVQSEQAASEKKVSAEPGVATTGDDAGRGHSEGHGHSHGHSHSHNDRGEDQEGRSQDRGQELGHSHSHSHGHGHSHDHSGSSSSSSSSGPLRSLPQIRSLLLASSPSFIPVPVRDLAIQTFTVLAEAESRTHGTTSPDDVHFHEVGAIDSIVDTVGTLLALHHLGVDLSSPPNVSCSPLPFGEGTVWTDHGQLPVPAFATVRLMAGMRTCPGPGAEAGIVTGELVTPTAAALLKVLTGDGRRVGRPPEGFVPRAVGVGAGTKDFERWPNVVRSIVGEVGPTKGRGGSRDVPAAAEAAEQTVAPTGDISGGREAGAGSLPPPRPASSPSKEASSLPPSATSAAPAAKSGEGTKKLSSSTKWSIDRLTHLECNVDDSTPELLSHVVDLLLKNGAVDAWSNPIVMKKGRSAWTLHCLCREDDGDGVGGNGGGGDGTVNRLLEVIFRHGTTLGVRIRRGVERAALRRKFVKVQTPYGCAEDGLGGTVDVKLGVWGGGDGDGGIDNDGEEEEEIVSVKAEFDHCRAISERSGVPLKTVAAYAERKAREELGLFPDP